MIEVDLIADVPAPGAPPPPEVERLLALAFASAGIEEGHVAVEYVTEEKISSLNTEFLGGEGPTDVISFPVDVDDAVDSAPRELGDIVICPAQTIDMREAIVHGALHLVGMDHETDNGEMLALQAEICSW